MSCVKLQVNDSVTFAAYRGTSFYFISFFFKAVAHALLVRCINAASSDCIVCSVVLHIYLEFIPLRCQTFSESILLLLFERWHIFRVELFGLRSSLYMHRAADVNRERMHSHRNESSVLTVTPLHSNRRPRYILRTAVSSRSV